MFICLAAYSLWHNVSGKKINPTRDPPNDRSLKHLEASASTMNSDSSSVWLNSPATDDARFTGSFLPAHPFLFHSDFPSAAEVSSS